MSRNTKYISILFIFITVCLKKPTEFPRPSGGSNGSTPPVWCVKTLVLHMSFGVNDEKIIFSVF